MSKNALEQATELVEQLTLDEKLRLVRQLEQDTLKARWERLLTDVDRRRKGRRFTMADIQHEIEAFRRERRQRCEDVNDSRRH